MSQRRGIIDYKKAECTAKKQWRLNMTELKLNYSGADEFSKFVRMLVVGPSGSGKTRFALTSPEPIWAAVKPGFTTLAKAGGVPFVNIQAEEDLFLLKQALENGTLKAETLVIDCVDELQKLLLDEHLRDERRDNLKADDWNWISQRLNAIAEGFSELPINIIWITHTKDVGVEDSLTVKTNIQGGFAEQIHRYVDYALYLESGSFNLNTVTGFDLNSDASGDEIVFETEVERVEDSVFRTRPTARYDWVHDMTNTLPEFFPLNFEDDFARIAQARGNVQLKASRSVSISDILDQKVEDAKGKQTIPGMSSQDKIAKLLKNK